MPKSNAERDQEILKTFAGRRKTPQFKQVLLGINECCIEKKKSPMELKHKEYLQWKKEQQSSTLAATAANLEQAQNHISGQHKLRPFRFAANMARLKAKTI